MKLSLSRSTLFHFLCAFFLRISLLLYGLYHDSMCNTKDNCVKYTDVDYYVFNDAARYVYHDESPYKRETYRYTPLLAIILQPNIFLLESFGKILFTLFDLLCGLLILRINKHEMDHYGLYFWFYNPLTIAISSRGNAESVMSFLVLLFIHLLLEKSYFSSGCLFASAIHFKIYPITYSLVILINLIQSGNGRFLQSLKNTLLFSSSFLVTFGSLTWYFYNKYGYDFLHETYLYHLTRKDIRHNFSAYFYLLYVNYNSNSILFKLATFLPQFILILVFSIVFGRHVKLSFFLITYSFVTFNKVCTSQYFVWYLSLMPILVGKMKISLRKACFLFVLWLLGQALWLIYAYRLEFKGENTFIQLWSIGLVFLIINCFIMKSGFIDTYQLEEMDDKKEN